MEAYSVEDGGLAICFCIYAYNVQPGVTIDYFTGANVANGEELPDIYDENDNRNENSDGSTEGEVCDYILNTSTKKFHLPGKSCAPKSDSKNYKAYSGTREDLIADNYVPCKSCNP